ncbi:MAG: hypothetical protein MZV63_32460 [Marinilabiliales bacterium]|nr:hypothetical protein [Marinilabiliales bacterium]
MHLTEELAIKYFSFMLSEEGVKIFLELGTGSSGIRRLTGELRCCT